MRHDTPVNKLLNGALCCAEYCLERRKARRASEEGAISLPVRIVNGVAFDVVACRTDRAKRRLPDAQAGQKSSRRPVR
jgi:hypothetical protein